MITIKDSGLTRAFVVTASHDYMPALHVLLNALEYYKNKTFDVYLLHAKGPSEVYANFIKDRYSFKITTAFVEEWGHPQADYNDNSIFAKYNFIPTLKQYNVICHSDADCLVLDNLDSYFDIVEKEENILCPHNLRSPYLFEQYNKIDKAQYCINQTLYNYPIFFHKKHMDIMHYMWSRINLANASTDPVIFNECLFDLKKHQYITPLLSDIWCGETVYHYNNMILDDTDEFKVIHPNSQRMKVWHSRWWNKTMSNHGLELTVKNSLCYNFAVENTKIGFKVIDFFSEKCFVTRTEFLTKYPEYNYIFNM